MGDSTPRLTFLHLSVKERDKAEKEIPERGDDCAA